MFLKIFWTKNGKDNSSTVHIEKAMDLVQQIEKSGIRTRFEVDIDNNHSSSEGVN